MAKWNGNKVSPEQINNGNEYNTNDNLSVEALNGIVNNSINAQKNAERALELAEGANEANGTVVKINGIAQGTWDATHSQKLYDESANLFDEKLSLGYVDNNTGTFTYTSSGTNLIGANYIPMKPNTVYSYKTSKSGLWIYEYDANENFLGYVDIVSGGSFTSKSNTAYFRVAFWGSYGTTYLNDAIVKEGTNPIYYPYNANRHITNSQAELLKSEWEKQVNLYDGVTLKGNIVANKNEVDYTSVDRLTSGTTYKVKPNTTYYISFDGLDRYDIYGFTYNKQYIGFDTGWIAKGGTFTTNSSTYYVRITFSYNDNAVINSVDELTNVMFNGGNPLPYQPYNSSSHITNAQADLLKSEHEKVENLFDYKTSTPNSYISSNGSLNSSSISAVSDYIEIKGSTSYYVRGYPTTTYYKTVVFYNSNKEVINAVESDVNSYYFLATSPANAKYVRFHHPMNNKELVQFIESYKISNPNELYDGQIVHDIDITPVLLWENASPNSSFASQTINVSQSLSNFKRIRVGYMRTIGENNAIHYMEFPIQTFLSSKNYRLYMIDSLAGTSSMEISTREFAITDDKTIVFKGGYVMSGQTFANDDKYGIPTSIFGLYY